MSSTWNWTLPILGKCVHSDTISFLGFPFESKTPTLSSLSLLTLSYLFWRWRHTSLRDFGFTLVAVSCSFLWLEYPDSIDQCCGCTWMRHHFRSGFLIHLQLMCALFFFFFSILFRVVCWISFWIQDAGLYRITVENELGRIQANARLDILSRSSGSRSSGFIRSGSAASAGRGAYYSPLSGSSASRLAGRALGMSSASYLRGSSTPRSGGGR